MSSRRVLLLLNPKSGQGNADVNAFRAALHARGHHVTERTLDDPERCPDHVRDARDHHAVVAAGGDGTVSSVAYELRGTNVPILAFPAGTANLIAQNLDLPGPAAHEDLADILELGHTVRTDLAEITAGPRRWGFTLIAGVGADAEMIRESERLKPRLGVAAYVLGAARQITPTITRFTLDLDGRRVETDGMSVLLANFGMANFRLPVTSGIDPTDGHLTVVVVKGPTALSLLPNLIDSVRSRYGLGDPIFDTNLETYQARAVTVTADHDLPVQYDGELLTHGLPVTARVLPGAALFLTRATRDDVRT
ncbi:diacylglycerol/lipid kinase family protein [Deinococcus pimensis]|uniref:diacylglycerol/lipid kinase family protein n=1 Tax=Deinococcus pimensis TaxID=309888 RepID=UPI001FE1441D|nr:diacylglycerol kinase family protein [Deinococcus pimensis]